MSTTSQRPEAETAQLLMVGSRGRGGFGSLVLGSVSSMLVHLPWLRRGR